MTKETTFGLPLSLLDGVILSYKTELFVSCYPNQIGLCARETVQYSAWVFLNDWRVKDMPKRKLCFKEQGVELSFVGPVLHHVSSHFHLTWVLVGMARGGDIGHPWRHFQPIKTAPPFALFPTLQALGLPYGNARIRHVMTKYDADHSGSVDVEEFTHYMTVRKVLTGVVICARPAIRPLIGLMPQSCYCFASLHDERATLVIQTHAGPIPQHGKTTFCS